MTTSFPPIANLGFKYANGCLVSYTDATHIVVAPGQLRDSTNVNDMVIAEAVTINTAAMGAGGLDTGTMANNTIYAVYALAQALDSSQYSATISVSDTEPALYDDWNIFRKVGHVLTNGSAQILPFFMTGDGDVRTMMYDTLISELAAGNATSFTDVNVASSVPLGKKVVHLVAALTPATAANQVKLRTNGLAATNGNVQMSGDVAAVVHTAPLDVQCDATAIFEYLVSNGSDAVTLYVAGYDEVL